MKAELQQRWEQLAPREQKILVLGGIALLISLFFALIWMPLNGAIESSQRRLESQRSTLAWMKEKGEVVNTLRANKVQQPRYSGTLESLVNQTAQKNRILISRLQPQGSGLQLGIDRVAFNDLMQWLGSLVSEYGVQVSIFEVERAEEKPGYVDVRRLVLERGEQ